MVQTCISSRWIIDLFVDDEVSLSRVGGPVRVGHSQQDGVISGDLKMMFKIKLQFWVKNYSFCGLNYSISGQ
jgi:hypothetical protein